MNTYTYSEKRQRLSSILDKARKEGKVLIKKKDSSLFELKAILQNKSPLDVKGINLSLNKKDIIDILQEVRERKKHNSFTYKKLGTVEKQKFAAK